MQSGDDSDDDQRTRIWERCSSHRRATHHPSQGKQDSTMNVIRLAALVGLVSFSYTTLTAEDEKPAGEKKKRPNVEELDTDKDGTLSKAELEAVPEKFRNKLLESDADKDGTLNKEEFAKAKEALKAHSREKAPK
jgi:EF hand